tara:strand:- start:485 stop:1087 length:603 start_codon:yes stop_codon:yes gene_type:complete
MREFYFYSERPINKTIEEAFIDFKIHTISKEAIKQNNIINKNILLVLNENLPDDFNDFFLSNNNIVIFFSKQSKQDKKKYLNTKVFSGHLNINKFIDEVITFFVSKSFIYKDLILTGDKIINSKLEKWAYLTPPEQNILILLFERKKIEKKLFLENVLNLKKDTETKTLESHLTRIRKKLLSIDSQIEIVSKENMVILVT